MYTKLNIVCISGINVHYSAEVAGIQPDNALLNCLLLLWTGDYSAQSEVGKFVCGGIHPCQRCALEGICSITLLILTVYKLLYVFLNHRRKKFSRYQLLPW